MKTSQKRRVLMVSCEGLGKGGVQSIMMGIIRNLTDKYSFDMLLFTTEKRYYDDEFLKYGGKIFRIPHYEGKSTLKRKLDPYIRDYRIYKETKKILLNEPPYEIIHCNKEYENAPILKAAYEMGVPIRISHTHICHKPGKWLTSIINHIRSVILNKYATQLVGCSKAAINSFYPQEDKALVINNFYNEDLFHYKENNQMLSTHKIIISQVGAFSINKNQLFSIKVINALFKQGVDVQLNLIGFNMDMEYRELLERTITSNKLQDRIKFISGTDDFINILYNSHLLIMPSYSEGFGISLIEAQAIGLHCFASTNIPSATNCGGVEYIDLDKGADYWATLIRKWNDQKIGIKEKYDTNKYKTKEVIKKYDEIYSDK